jgi:hypothetical protein
MRLFAARVDGSFEQVEAGDVLKGTTGGQGGVLHDQGVGGGFPGK